MVTVTTSAGAAIAGAAMPDELARGGELLAIEPAALAAHHPVRAVDQWLQGYSALIEPATEPRDR